MAKMAIVFKHSLQQSVGLSDCPVHCGKMADQIQMHFGMVGRMDPRMRQVVGFGPQEGIILWANVGHPTVTNAA